MKFKIILFYLVILFSFLQISLINGEENKQSENLYSDIDDSLENLDKGNFQRLEFELRVYNSKTESEIIFYFLDSFENKNMNELAQSKFLDLNLDEKGVPLLNLLIFYSIEGKSLKIVYSEGCVLNGTELDILSKSAAEGMNNADDYTPLVELAEELAEITQSKFDEIKNNPILYCPIPETKQYNLIEDEEESCEPFFDGDEFEEGRLKVLILGKDFGDEGEFNDAINKYVMQEGFQKIEPFKLYVKEGHDGLFYFVKGNYNINAYFGSSRVDLEGRKRRQEEMNNEISKCSNIFYTIVLINETESKNFRSFYLDDLKVSFNILEENVLIHETGHRFHLADEYYEHGVGDFSNSQDLYLGCTKNPSDWDEILEGLGDHDFKTCKLKTNYYRSSFQGIMRNAFVYSKFNFLNCLFLVREFEKSSITDSRVRDTCEKLYSSDKLQKPNEIDDEDYDYVFCSDRKEHIPSELDCKDILLDCAKNEDRENRISRCIIEKIPRRIEDDE